MRSVVLYLTTLPLLFAQQLVCQEASQNLVPRARQFTPEAMISAPRRTSGVPNSDGSLVFYTVSRYDFATQDQSSEARVLDTITNNDRLLGEGDLSELEWLDKTMAVGLRAAEEGERTDIVIGDVGNWNSSYVVHTVNATVSGLRVTSLGNGNYGIVISGKANPDGSPYNSEAAPTPPSTARIYQKIFVRHWDEWITPQRNAIWYAALEKSGNSNFTLSQLVNAVTKNGVESPIPPFGATDNYDISRNGLVFVAKDPTLNYAINTKGNLYFVPLSTFRETDAAAQVINVPGFDGAMASPKFSRSGNQMGFLVMRQNGYESDKNNIFLVTDLKNPTQFTQVLPGWDKTPAALALNDDASIVLVVAPDAGQEKLYVAHKESTGYVLSKSLDVDKENVHGSVSDMRVIDGNSVLISSSSFIDPSVYTLLNTGGFNGTSYVEVSTASNHGRDFGLSQKQVSSFWYPGADPGRMIQSHMIVPSGFDSSQSYPLAFLIHGGPQVPWDDAWSTRWNGAVWAEQGYVVIMPNPTGSPGFGQNFTDRIQSNWGGTPYQDLVNCMDYIEQNMPFVDMDRAIAAGASYGGYMVNWIQGQPLGRRFKALMTHDGVFSTSYEIATEELWFIYHDFGGTWSKNRATYDRWNPAAYTQNWATPHLVVHSEMDYRLTIADGLAAFNILQTQGIESEFLSYPDETHWVTDPENSLVWHKTVLNFLNRHAGLPAAGNVTQYVMN